MKSHISITYFFLFFLSFNFSCKSIRTSEIENLNSNKVLLLVADSSIFGSQTWQANQFTNKVIPVGAYDVGFVDSLGKAAHQPMQTIIFSKPESRILQKLLSKFTGNSQPKEEGACIHLYRHVFQWYLDERLVKQISLCLDCSTFYIEPEKITIDINQNEAITYKQLISLLKQKGAYLFSENDKNFR